MAKEATPVLSGAIPLLELFMSKWESLAKKNVVLRPFIEEGLVKAREYYCKMDLTRAYVISLGWLLESCFCWLLALSLTNLLSLVLNPIIKLTWIKKHWEDKYIEIAEHMVKEEVSGHCPISPLSVDIDT